MTENLPAIATESIPVAEFELDQRKAKILSHADILPGHYKGNLGNCYIAVHTAKQLNMDPLMFMQRSFVVHGKLGIEGQLVIALINQRGPYIKRLKWSFDGKEGTDAYTCYCRGWKTETDYDEIKISIKDVKAMGWWSNKIWQNMTDQMLRYRTATFLARAHCPEVLMGFHTEDELRDIKATSVESGPSAKLNAAIQLTQEEESEVIDVTVSEEQEVNTVGKEKE